MAVEDEVRQASEQFYAALNSTINGDPGPMRRSGHTAQTPPPCTRLVVDRSDGKK